jgi:hypothetical protein
MGFLFCCKAKFKNVLPYKNRAMSSKKQHVSIVYDSAKVQEIRHVTKSVAKNLAQAKREEKSSKNKKRAPKKNQGEKTRSKKYAKRPKAQSAGARLCLVSNIPSALPTFECCLH